MQAVLMVAGKSTRTYPLTLTRPKPLLPVMNVPLIKHSLDQLAGLFDEAILIVGYRREMILDVLGDRYNGMAVKYVEQKKQLGTGHAILQAKPLIKDRFVALNGDDLFAHADLKKLTGFQNGALVKEVADPSQYGVFEIDGQDRVVNLVEKPKTFISNLANIGCYVFEPDIFTEIENTPLSERGEIEITGAILSMAKKKPFHAIPISGFWLPTGFAWDLLHHQEFFMSTFNASENNGEVENGATIKGAVAIGKGSMIRAGAYIEGPVIIGEQCDIGPNCYLRPYTSIGDFCRIGHAVEIKNSIVMDRCHIAHLSYIGDSVVGYDCNLGAGTITANVRHDGEAIHSFIKGKKFATGRKKLGAILADGVRTGIHTSIYPGRKIWPNMTTRPGAVVDRDMVSASET